MALHVISVIVTPAVRMAVGLMGIFSRPAIRMTDAAISQGTFRSLKQQILLIVCGQCGRQNSMWTPMTGFTIDTAVTG